VDVGDEEAREKTVALFGSRKREAAKRKEDETLMLMGTGMGMARGGAQGAEYGVLSMGAENLKSLVM